MHRECQYNVKGISINSFTEEDVQQLSREGNDAHIAIYMARFTLGEYPIPNGLDPAKLKVFIRMKYINRRLYGEESVHVRTAESNPSTVTNFQSKISKDILSWYYDNAEKVISCRPSLTRPGLAHMSGLAWSAALDSKSPSSFVTNKPTAARPARGR